MMTLSMMKMMAILILIFKTSSNFCKPRLVRYKLYLFLKPQKYLFDLVFIVESNETPPSFPSPSNLLDNPDSPHSSYLSSSLTSNLSVSQHFSGGKPNNIKRGPGRPRKEFMGIKLFKDNKVIKKVRTSTFIRNPGQNSYINKKKVFREELSLNTLDATSSFSSLVLPSPNDEYSNMSLMSYDAEIGDKLMQPPEEPIYFTEKYSGKLCALCNLPERSQLGQGEMIRCKENDESQIETFANSSFDDKESLALTLGDNSPRNLNTPQLSNRRQKGHNKCK